MADAPTLPTVLLRHELPDGTFHFDWMIAQDPAASGPLATFRLDQRVDELSPGTSITADRIDDHRPRYLHYEGPIEGERGVVDRLARGVVETWEREPSRWSLAVRWIESGLTQELQLELRGDDRWELTVLP